MSEEWDVVPHMKKNFRCTLVNGGKWRLEKTPTYGKCIFLCEPINKNITAPTFGDQRNFFTGLFEAEWRNDNYLFNNGVSRDAQRPKKIEMFDKIIQSIKNRADVKDTAKGLEFYIQKFKQEDEDEGL